MKHRSADMCNLFTGGTPDTRRTVRDGMREICLRPTEDGGLGMSAEEAEARVKACNIPLQVGVGLAGGAEVAIQLLQEHLRRNPGHAIASDDKRNGFNCISRKAIFAGLRRWFPELIPTVALWYSEQRRLFLSTQRRGAARATPSCRPRAARRAILSGPSSSPSAIIGPCSRCRCATRPP